MRIFRQVRDEALSEGRLGRYLRYALGEIVLVAIGILMALQVNNWNDDRLERKQVRAYTQALVSDLAHDTQMLVPVDGQIRTLIRQIDSLAGYVHGKQSVHELNNADLFFYTYDLSYRPYAWSRATLERLKTTGTLEQIGNAALVAKISEYDALTRHLDQDYLNDVTMIRDAAAFANRVRDANYEQLPAIRAYFHEVPDDNWEAAVFAFLSTQTFRDMQSANLPLVTNDVKDVDVMVNELLDVRASISPRVDSELPRLRAMAAEITRMVAKEFP